MPEPRKIKIGPSEVPEEPEFISQLLPKATFDEIDRLSRQYSEESNTLVSYSQRIKDTIASLREKYENAPNDGSPSSTATMENLMAGITKLQKYGSAIEARKRKVSSIAALIQSEVGDSNPIGREALKMAWRPVMAPLMGDPFGILELRGVSDPDLVQRYTLEDGRLVDASTSDRAYTMFLSDNFKRDTQTEGYDAFLASGGATGFIASGGRIIAREVERRAKKTLAGENSVWDYVKMAFAPAFVWDMTSHALDADIERRNDSTGVQVAGFIPSMFTPAGPAGLARGVGKGAQITGKLGILGNAGSKLAKAGAAVEKASKWSNIPKVGKYIEKGGQGFDKLTKTRGGQTWGLKILPAAVGGVAGYRGVEGDFEDKAQGALGGALAGYVGGTGLVAGARIAKGAASKVTLFDNIFRGSKSVPVSSLVKGAADRVDALDVLQSNAPSVAKTTALGGDGESALAMTLQTIRSATDNLLRDATRRAVAETATTPDKFWKHHALRKLLKSRENKRAVWEIVNREFPGFAHLIDPKRKNTNAKVAAEALKDTVVRSPAHTRSVESLINVDELEWYKPNEALGFNEPLESLLDESNPAKLADALAPGSIAGPAVTTNPALVAGSEDIAWMAFEDVARRETQDAQDFVALMGDQFAVQKKAPRVPGRVRGEFVFATVEKMDTPYYAGKQEVRAVIEDVFDHDEDWLYRVRFDDETVAILPEALLREDTERVVRAAERSQKFMDKYATAAAKQAEQKNKSQQGSLLAEVSRRKLDEKVQSYRDIEVRRLASGKGRTPFKDATQAERMESHVARIENENATNEELIEARHGKIGAEGADQGERMERFVQRSEAEDASHEELLDHWTTSLERRDEKFTRPQRKGRAPAKSASKQGLLQQVSAKAQLEDEGWEYVWDAPAPKGPGDPKTIKTVRADEYELKQEVSVIYNRGTAKEVRYGGRIIGRHKSGAYRVQITKSNGVVTDVSVKADDLVKITPEDVADDVVDQGVDDGTEAVARPDPAPDTPPAQTVAAAKGFDTDAFLAGRGDLSDGHKSLTRSLFKAEMEAHPNSNPAEKIERIAQWVKKLSPERAAKVEEQLLAKTWDTREITSVVTGLDSADKTRMSSAFQADKTPSERKVYDPHLKPGRPPDPVREQRGRELQGLGWHVREVFDYDEIAENAADTLGDEAAGAAQKPVKSRPATSADMPWTYSELMHKKNKNLAELIIKQRILPGDKRLKALVREINNLEQKKSQRLSETWRVLYSFPGWEALTSIAERPAKGVTGEAVLGYAKSVRGKFDVVDLVAWVHANVPGGIDLNQAKYIASIWNPLTPKGNRRALTQEQIQRLGRAGIPLAVIAGAFLLDPAQEDAPETMQAGFNPYEAVRSIWRAVARSHATSEVRMRLAEETMQRVRGQFDGLAREAIEAYSAHGLTKGDRSAFAVINGFLAGNSPKSAAQQALADMMQEMAGTHHARFGAVFTNMLGDAGDFVKKGGPLQQNLVKAVKRAEILEHTYIRPIGEVMDTMLKQFTLEEREALLKHIDTNTISSIADPMGRRIAEFIADTFEQLLQMQNNLRALQGRKPIKRISGYITHFFRKTMDDRRKMMQDGTYKVNNVFERYRSGEEGYVKDAAEAFGTYFHTVAKDMLYGHIEKDFDLYKGFLSPSVRQFTEGYLNVATGKYRSLVDRMLMDRIGVGVEWATNSTEKGVKAQRFAEATAQRFNTALYVLALGGSPKSALMNLGQSLHTMAEVGPKHTFSAVGDVLQYGLGTNVAGAVVGGVSGVAAGDTAKEKVGYGLLGAMAGAHMGARAGKHLLKNPQGQALSDLINKILPDLDAIRDTHKNEFGVMRTIWNEFTDSPAGMGMFQEAEMFNRKIAALAGHRQAVANGLRGEDAIRFARDVVEKTQFWSFRTNQPGIIRAAGTAGKPFMAFKQFPIKSANLFLNNSVRDFKLVREALKAGNTQKAVSAALPVLSSVAIAYGGITVAAEGLDLYLEDETGVTPLEVYAQMTKGGEGSMISNTLNGVVSLADGPVRRFLGANIDALSGESGTDLGKAYLDFFVPAQVKRAQRIFGQPNFGPNPLMTARVGNKEVFLDAYGNTGVEATEHRKAMKFYGFRSQEEKEANDLVRALKNDQRSRSDVTHILLAKIARSMMIGDVNSTRGYITELSRTGAYKSQYELQQAISRAYRSMQTDSVTRTRTQVGEETYQRVTSK